MAIALKDSQINSQSPFKLPPLLGLIRAWIIGTAWHTRAYSTILGILVLTALSLVVLQLHHSSTQLLAFLSSRSKFSAISKQQASAR
jgi:hypothetical protein